MNRFYGQFSYPPRETGSAWEFTVYFKPDTTKSCWFQGTGNFFGAAADGQTVIPPYLAESVNHVYERPDDLRIDVYGSKAGTGGYDRVGIRFRIPDQYEAPNTNLSYSMCIIKVFIELDIRSMEDPTTTDFELDCESTYLIAPQQIELSRWQYLMPGQRRYLKICYGIQGEYKPSSIGASNYTLCTLSWKDKTGVPGDQTSPTIRTELLYIVQSSVVNFLHPKTNLPSFPGDLMSMVSEANEDRTSESSFDLCALDDSG